MEKKNTFKFGDQIKPVSSYNDNKERRFVFMSWMGNDLAGYARVAVIQPNGCGFDESGEWIENKGVVLESDVFVHKSVIEHTTHNTKHESSIQ